MLRAFLRKDDELLAMSDEALAAMALEELKHTLPLRGAPCFTHCARVADGLPQYELGHMEMVRKVRDGARRWPGLYICGASYEGIGIPDCIKQGEQAALEAQAYLSALAERSALAA